MVTGPAPTLQDRLAMLGVIASGRPRLRAEADRGPAYELRRSVWSVREVFGRDVPHPADAGAVYLDTETTGLAGGTGTTPFLIGLATADGDAVTVEQYFLRRLSGEAEMLEAVRDRLVEADALVTFNGRRFDWPILEARFIMSRMPLDPPADHTDLITTARRLWYRPLGTYRLTAIERHALGIERGDDVDSALIPGMYLEYLRTGDAGPLEPVFAHNQHDVLCLLHLRRCARRWIEGGEDPPPPVDWEGLGVLRLQAEDTAGALSSLRRALAVEDDPAVRWRIATRIARILRREARWEEILSLWEHEAAGLGVWRVRALIERAKVLQRRVHQPEQAIAVLNEARTALEWLLIAGNPYAPALNAELGRRLTRLHGAAAAATSGGLRRPTAGSS